MHYANLEKHVQSQVFLNTSIERIYAKQHMKSVLNVKFVSFWKKNKKEYRKLPPKERKLFNGTLYVQT